MDADLHGEDGHPAAPSNAKSAPPTPKAGPWMHAWHDQLAGLRTHNACVRLADIEGDGDYRLIVADHSRRLKVYRGTSVSEVVPLMENPVALCCFRFPNAQGFKSLAIAVAAGPSVYIYRSLRPYFKFTLPAPALDARETSAWTALRESPAGDADKAWDALAAARSDGAALSSHAERFLALRDAEARRTFAALPPPAPDRPPITCMEALPKGADGGPSYLVLGTEEGGVVVLDPPSSVVAEVRLRSVPALLAVGGSFDGGDWRVAVACRDGRIYTVKAGETRRSAVVTGTAIELGTPATALARQNKSLYAATTDDRLLCFSLKGRRNFALTMPAAVSSLEPLDTRTCARLLVALANREIRIYNEKVLVHSLSAGDTPAALRFGRYAREEHALAIVGRAGALTVKMLSRRASLDPGSGNGTGGGGTGPPPEQDIPLPVPKRTRLYVDLMEREKAHAPAMHRAFQRDLCLLRLRAARTYVGLVAGGELAGGSGSGKGGSAAPAVRLTAECRGLGPKFKVRLGVQNAGARTLVGAAVAVAGSASLYKFERSLIPLPILLPGLTVFREADVTSIDPAGAAGALRVFVVAPEATTPLVSAVLQMPPSELLDV